MNNTIFTEILAAALLFWFIGTVSCGWPVRWTYDGRSHVLQIDKARR